MGDWADSSVLQVACFPPGWYDLQSGLFFVFVCIGVLVMRLTTAILVLLVLVGGGGGTALSMQEADFVRDIQPLLQAHCQSCHDSSQHSGGLDLQAGLVRGGESGAVVVPGQPGESLLLQVVESGVMPPEGEPRLSAEQTELLRRWIAGGARLPGPQQFPTVTSDRIEALLLLRCAACHGAARQEGGLDLRTRESLLRGGRSGPAAIPGQPDSSLMLQKIAGGQMPPVRRLVEAMIKPITDSETELLRQWIAAGMPQSAVADDHPSELPAGARDFWSFQSPRAADLPAVSGGGRVQTPVDNFVLQRLQQAGLTFSEPADPAVLVRRLYFDLTGLPPTWQQVQQVLQDPGADRISRLIDQLLQSPQYGVRWGQHWLDAAGYADSEGAQNEDRIRADMWRYRDYVIQAFNADKPYDRFLHEQLAGDELADYGAAPEVTQELYDNLVATGFLRTAPDRTFANITAFVPDRLEVIADELQILGSAVLGLTINCARCHSHKFDPLSQTDYYRLSAVFKDAWDEHDWLKPLDERLLPHVTAVERAGWLQQKQSLEQQIEQLQQRRESADESVRRELDGQITALQKQIPAEPRIRALWSRGRPSPTWVLLRGDYLKPGRRVQPGVPEVLEPAGPLLSYQPPWPGADKTGARLAFARWLTKPDHPLTARVMVNRIWMHHFGRGLVETPGNFGIAGARPSHPELLDWLAVEFVKSGWSVKAMHRLLLNSAVWQQSSQITETAQSLDPENRLWSRMPLRRVDAESLRDGLLLVSGSLSDRFYGPADPLEVRGDGLVTVRSEGGVWRRSVFALHRRTQIPSLLDSFDYPQMGPNCVQRGESLAAPQTLQLLNGGQVHELSGRLAERVLREAVQAEPLQSTEEARDLRIRWLYRMAVQREPEAGELHELRGSLQQLVEAWRQADLEASGSGAVSAVSAELRGFQNLCHAVLNSAAFVMVD